MTIQKKISIPSPPNFVLLRFYVVFSGIISLIAFFWPIDVALSFSGRIASNGPTSTINSSSDALLEYIAPLNKKLKKDDTLFVFQQPSMKGDIAVMVARLNSLNQKQSTLEKTCRSLRKTLEESKRHAIESYNMNALAYKQEAISKIKLLSYREKINEINRDIETHNQRCEEQMSSIIGDLNILEEEINRQRSQNNFIREIKAPDDGFLHTLQVKLGQRINSAQYLANFTAEGTTGASLTIPLRDRPFIHIDDTFRVTSESYLILKNPPIRECTIQSITPDVVDQKMGSTSPSESIFKAECSFQESPLTGDDPFLVGMDIDASTTSEKVSLMTILINGYRRTILSRG
ncbi:MAG: HlyD family efflux transporter periplasmic adaptor subunit [Rhodobacteraceae bacterium]|nr:HlyD family efflux transporter periplasmic adaptor subunit [Paracoccaceae bacterium]